jgi:predicted transcriptional regulator
MKKDIKEKAIELRTQGESITAIAKQLHVAKSTVSLWVRDVELTPQQIENLLQNSRNSRKFISDLSRIRGGRIYSENCRRERKGWQDEGRQLARKGDPEFVAGCMLYWGEGGKTVRSVANMTNSDPDILVYFLCFVRKYYKVDETKLFATINCHLDYGLGYTEILEFWSNTLNIPTNQFWKPQIHQGVPRTKGKHKRLKYGTCSVRISNVRIIQSILGAIQEIANVSKPEWLG